jgi:hypothetical protein
MIGSSRKRNLLKLSQRPRLAFFLIILTAMGFGLLISASAYTLPFVPGAYRFAFEIIFFLNLMILAIPTALILNKLKIYAFSKILGENEKHQD